MVNPEILFKTWTGFQDFYTIYPSAVLSHQEQKIPRRSVNKKWNLIVYTEELLLTALIRSVGIKKYWGHHVEGTRQEIGYN